MGGQVQKERKREELSPMRSIWIVGENESCRHRHRHLASGDKTRSEQDPAKHSMDRLEFSSERSLRYSALMLGAGKHVFSRRVHQYWKSRRASGNVYSSTGWLPDYSNSISMVRWNHPLLYGVHGYIFPSWIASSPLRPLSHRRRSNQQKYQSHKVVHDVSFETGRKTTHATGSDVAKRPDSAPAHSLE